MKKSLFIMLMYCCLATQVFAQGNLLNGGFEDTTIVYIDTNYSDTIISSWTKSSFGAGVTTDARSGNLAAFVSNWYFYAKGVLTNGSSDGWQGEGAPIAFRPGALNGFYKYLPGDISSDTNMAVAEVWLFKYNNGTNTRDTLGYGKTILGTMPNYTEFNVDIDYTSQDTPDTVLVQFTSSQNGFCDVSSNGNCLFLYIDDVSLSNETGINQDINFTKQLKVYPNPASTHLFIAPPTEQVKENFVIYNTLGEPVMSAPAASHIEVSTLPNGIYVIKGNGMAQSFVKQ